MKIRSIITNSFVFLKSLKPLVRGNHSNGLLIIQGVNPLIGRATQGPNPTANLVSVIWEGRWNLYDFKKFNVYRSICWWLV